MTVFWIEVDVLSVTEVTDKYQWVDPVRLHSMINTDAIISDFRGQYNGSNSYYNSYQPDDVSEGCVFGPGIYHPRTAPLWR